MEEKESEMDSHWLELMDLCKKAEVHPADCNIFSLIGNDIKLKKIIDEKQRIIDLVNSWLVTIDLMNSNPDLIKTLKEIGKNDKWVNADELFDFDNFEFVHGYKSVQGSIRTTYCNQVVTQDELKWMVQNHDMTCRQCIKNFNDSYRCPKGCELRCCEGKCQCGICVEHPIR